MKIEITTNELAKEEIRSYYGDCRHRRLKNAKRTKNVNCRSHCSWKLFSALITQQRVWKRCTKTAKQPCESLQIRHDMLPFPASCFYSRMYEIALGEIEMKQENCKSVFMTGSIYTQFSSGTRLRGESTKMWYNNPIHNHTHEIESWILNHICNVMRVRECNRMSLWKGEIAFYDIAMLLR